jgi:cell shape-determining protein MreC
MMQRYGYLILAALLLIFLSIPQTFSNEIRSKSIASVQPLWRNMGNIKDFFVKITTILPSGGYHTPPEVLKELEMIRLENYQLLSQLSWLKEEIKLTQQLVHLKENISQWEEKDEWSLRRKDEIQHQIELYSHAITARIIFREPSAWRSSVWVNVGEETNRRVGSTIIQKNSPVVLGTTVVGLVDFVGKTRSRVRFLTDQSVTLSVRAIRGLDQRKFFLKEAEKMSTILSLFENGKLTELMKPILDDLRDSLAPAEKDFYLAKGEIQGSARVMWRGRKNVLNGIGFNYDFEDLEGPSRDLKTGDSKGFSKKGIPLIKVGDMVVTTGMDGIFPAGLKVGTVCEVSQLTEGASSYSSLILSLVPDFDELSFLTILPCLCNTEGEGDTNQ